MVKTKVWKIARGSPCTNNLESLCGKYNKTGAFINWMHSTDKLIANLTQNDIEAISNRVFKNKVTHSEKKNLENKKKNGSRDTCSNLELQNWYETLTTHVEKLPHTYISRFWTKTLEDKKKHHILFCKVVYKLSVWKHFAHWDISPPLEYFWTWRY